MKILWIFIVICICMVQQVNCAPIGRFGIECAPAISYNSVYCTSKPKIERKSNQLKAVFTVFYHIPLQNHCHLSTGLSCALGHIGLQRPKDTTKDPVIQEINDAHSLRYVHIPCLARFYTNEVKLDTSLYATLGPLLSIRLLSRPDSTDPSVESTLIEPNLFHLFLLFGLGVKYDFSPENSLTAGLSYCHDLFGVMRNKRDDHSGKVYVHNSFIRFDFGCLF